MTTTIKLIREQQYTLIRALTPASIADQKFVRYRIAGDFADWADGHKKSAFRIFSITAEHDEETPHQSDGISDEVETTVTVSVAYPKDARYGLEHENDAMDIIREDKHQIDAAIGINGSANYVAGQNKSESDSLEVDELENVWIAKLQFRITFRRAIS